MALLALKELCVTTNELSLIWVFSGDIMRMKNKCKTERNRRMKQIASMIIRMKGREKYFLIFSYMANVMVTCILIMIATGIKNITNESLADLRIREKTQSPKKPIKTRLLRTFSSH